MLSLWRDATSELWILVLFPQYYCNPLLQFLLCLLFCNLLFRKQFFIHTIRLTLCVQQNQWAWQPHWIVGAKYSGCLCAGSTLLLTPVVRPAISPSATPSEATPFSYWSINLGFVIEGNLLLCSSYLPLGVHQLRSTIFINSTPRKHFSGAVAIFTWAQSQTYL